MDLGLNGKRALVCAGSRGLGRACAIALAREGCEVTITGRDEAALHAAAASISAAGARVSIASGDIATASGRESALRACPAPDILVTNAGGPPVKDFRELSHAEWLAAIETNMLSAISMITATIDGMVARRFGRIVNITSMTEVRPKVNLDLSNATRLGLAGFARGVALQVARHNVTINNILPGPFATDRQAAFVATASAFVSASPSGRMGNPGELGDACAFLCGQNAGFITGQSLLIDGGFAMAGP